MATEGEGEAEAAPRPISRRTFLTGAVAALGATGLGACRASPPGRSDTTATTRTAATTKTTASTPAAKVPNGGPSLSPGGPAAAVAHGRRDRRQVALTFHLGPNVAAQDVDLAHQLLAEARRLQAPITVFAVGQWLETHAELVPLILQDGNELDNHTFTHPVLTQLDAARVAQEIDGCRDVLARLAPEQGRYFRPSGTSQATPTIVAQAGAAGYRTVVDYDVDSLDYTDPGADAVVAAVRAGVQPGSIVSLHFGHPGTIAALPRVVGDLHTRGLQPVLLRDLFV